MTASTTRRRPVTVRKLRWEERLPRRRFKPWFWACSCGATGHHATHEVAIWRANHHARYACPTARRTR